LRDTHERARDLSIAFNNEEKERVRKLVVEEELTTKP